MLKYYVQNESVKPASQGQETKQEHELQDEIKKLESEVKDKDSAINDLNEKLMERLNECRVLREENETARKNINMSSDLQVCFIKQFCPTSYRNTYMRIQESVIRKWIALSTG